MLTTACIDADQINQVQPNVNTASLCEVHQRILFSALVPHEDLPTLAVLVHYDPATSEISNIVHTLSGVCGKGGVLLSSAYTIHTLQRDVPNVLETVLYCVIQQLFLPFTSCLSDINAFIYFIIFYYISNFVL